MFLKQPIKLCFINLSSLNSNKEKAGIIIEGKRVRTATTLISGEIMN